MDSVINKGVRGFCICWITSARKRNTQEFITDTCITVSEVDSAKSLTIVT